MQISIRTVKENSKGFKSYKKGITEILYILRRFDTRGYLVHVFLIICKSVCETVNQVTRVFISPHLVGELKNLNCVF